MIKLDNVAGGQNRGVRALLTNHELNALDRIDIAVEPLSANVQHLCLCGVTHSVVTQARCERLRLLAQSVQHLSVNHVLAGPQLLSGERLLTLLLSNHMNLVADVVLGAAGRVVENVVVNEVVGGKLVRLNLQISLKSAVIGNGEVLTLYKTQHIRGRNPVAGGRVFCGGNVQRHGAVLGTPLIGVARTLHVNGTALGRDEESIHAIVLVTVRNGCLKSGGLLHRLGIRLRLGLLLSVLSRGQVGSLSAVRALEIQILPGQQSAATLRSPTHDGSHELIAALVAIVTPHFNGVLLGRIQGMSGNLNIIDEVPVLVLERILGIVVLDNVANSQDRGVRALLTNQNLHALGGLNITVKVPTSEEKLLVLGRVGEGAVTPMRGKGLGLLMTLDLRSGAIRQGAGSNGGGDIRNHVMS